MGKIQLKNYFCVPHFIIEHKDETGKWQYPIKFFDGSASRLYLVLLHFANRFGSPFFMGDDRLTEITGLSYRQLCRLRIILRRLGLIKTHKAGGNKLEYEIIILP